jgi:Putative NADPH-quinone reductase (modulator of drug activity B)
MNHLIVYAHPSSDSFSNKIMTITKEFSVEKEYKTEIRDLYSIGFDPILKASDLKKMYDGETPDEIKREQNYIEWADLITFIYPVWWTGMPAILKGYIDRVFSYGIAYKQSKSGEEGLLKGKIVFLFSPMGTSNEAYDKNGMLDSMKQTCDEGIFKFCGMNVIKHVFFGSASNLEHEMENQYLKAIPLVISKGFPSNKSNEENKENKDNENKKDAKENQEDKDNSKEEDNKDSSKSSKKDKPSNNNEESNDKLNMQNSKMSK